LLIQSKASAISIDSPTSLDKTLEIFKDKSVVIGNISTDLFRAGSKEEMESAVKRCFDISEKCSRFILASGCEIPIISKDENVSCFMESAKKFGKVDIEN
ncbi:hypothetical protein KKB18_07015, partial [bacterium]|nr:hypothetical protein [bacterium]